jgi:hypothetical protein
MPNNPLEKMANIKDLGQLYLNGSEQERSALIQNIQIKTETFNITKEDRANDAKAEADAAQKKIDDAKPHYGGFLLGTPVPIRYMSIPVPKGGKGEGKAGPPDRISVSARASAAQFRDFYKDALPKYGWKAAGNCWERDHPSSKKNETLCLEAGNNSAVIQITEK